jgi:hypothetical protein
MLTLERIANETARGTIYVCHGAGLEEVRA